eukprot:m.450994 g.450994  ORF g.450994 m.450994 type:complete len:91 (-) comp56910_c2_seq4:501-773(-)
MTSTSPLVPPRHNLFRNSCPILSSNHPNSNYNSYRHKHSHLDRKCTPRTSSNFNSKGNNLSSSSSSSPCTTKSNGSSTQRDPIWSKAENC